MKKNILKKFAIAIASTSLALTAPVMSDTSVFGTVQTVEAATVKTPGTVKLNKISAPAYNKIKISWKKASNATKYYVYYRKSGTKKWKKIASVKSSATSYTHKSSSKYPIIVGQKYDYTVKAYNSKTKKSGKYNTKGLTISTKPDFVITRKGIVNYRKPEVTVYWSEATGCTHYVIYRKTANSDWKKIDTVANNVTTYIDNKPVESEENYYTVRGYYAPTKAYGDYDTKGICVTVPSYAGKDDSDDDITPPRTDYTEAEFAEEVFCLTNLERAKAGRSQLQHHSELSKAAMLRAKEITSLFSHTRPNGEFYDTVSGEFNVACLINENIGGATTPEAIVEAWMKSDGHRWALLSSSATHLGVGVYKEGDMYNCVQLFSTNPDRKETLTLDANGGTFPDNGNVSTITMQVPHGGFIYPSKNFPTPLRNGYTFNGWEDEYGCSYKKLCITVSEKHIAKWLPNN